MALIPLILKHVNQCIYVNHTNMSCFAATMFMQACERTVLEWICIMENQVVFESSSLCKTKAPRFVSFLKHPCFHSIHFWTKRTRLGHLLQVLIIYFAALNWANTIMKLSLFSTDSGSVIKKIPFEKIRSFEHWERRPSKGLFCGPRIKCFVWMESS